MRQVNLCMFSSYTSYCILIDAKRGKEYKGMWSQRDRRGKHKRESETASERNIKEPLQLTRLGKARSQLEPSARGKHQEPATPNVTLRTLLSSEMASQFSWQDMTFYLGLPWKKTLWQPPADTHLGDTPGPTERPWLFPQKWEKFANMIWCKRAGSSWR